MANLYQRHLLAETMESYFDAGEEMPVPPFMDAMERPFDEDYSLSTPISMTIPAASALGYCTMWCPLLSPEIYTNPNQLAIVRDSDSQAFTFITGSGSIGAFECRVDPQSNYLDFNSARAGDEITVTVLASESVINADLVRRLFTEVSALITWGNTIKGSGGTGNSTITATAGEDIPKGCLVYLYLEASTLKMKKADINNPATYPMGYMNAAVATGDQGAVTVNGVISDFGSSGSVRTTTPAAGAYLFGSPTAGSWTWSGDTTGDKLLAGEPEVCIGHFIGGTNALLCFGQHPRWIV